MKDEDILCLEPPKLNFFERMYFPAIGQGLQITGEHFFKKKCTEQYPDVDHEAPDKLNYRGVHRLNRDHEGRVRCVACFMCSTACPAHCIDIVAEESPWEDREKYPQSFVIDELRCIFCGMCEEACPVDAIELTSMYDLTGLTREQMMFDKEMLLSVYDETESTEPMKSKVVAHPKPEDRVTISGH